jgi:hypothetical protein
MSPREVCRNKQNLMAEMFSTLSRYVICQWRQIKVVVVYNSYKLVEVPHIEFEQSVGHMENSVYNLMQIWFFYTLIRLRI